MFQIENSLKGFEKMTFMLAKKGLSLESFTVVLEPTNTYHVDLIYWLLFRKDHRLRHRKQPYCLSEELYAQKANVCLANPKDVHHYAKSLGRDSKTDRLDCFALAQFGLTRKKLHIWQPPSKTVRQLDALIRLRNHIVCDRVREENRLDSLPSEEICFVGNYLQQQIDLFKQQEAMVNAEIQKLIAKDKALKPINARLRSIPGIGPVVASFLIVLFSNRDFQNGMQAAAFCGLIPKEYQSGTSIEGKPRMTKRGPGYIRAGLRVAATAVLVTKKPNPLKEYYERLVESGKAKASALGALMHKLVIVAFAIWRDEVEYQYGNP
ncbi:MAG: transposase [Proteobacteria bacterium]|nr:transposase [Pseudomonadota bacterium]